MRSIFVAVWLAAAAFGAASVSAQPPDEQAATAAELERLRSELEQARARLEAAARDLASRSVPVPGSITSVYRGALAQPQENRLVVLRPRVGGFVVEPGEGAGQPSAGVVLGNTGVNVFSAARLRSLDIAASPWGEMELVPMTSGLARYFGTEEGLLVVRAPSDDSIGVEDGDVILAIGGRIPSSPEHAIRILASFDPGETIEFSLMREGVRETVEYDVR